MEAASCAHAQACAHHQPWTAPPRPRSPQETRVFRPMGKGKEAQQIPAASHKGALGLEGLLTKNRSSTACSQASGH